jgi:hypothetical protein
MIDPLTRQRLEDWVADFCHGDALAGVPAVVTEHAPTVLLVWMVTACERRDIEPEDLEAEDLRGALLDTMSQLELPDAVHSGLCELGRDFLVDLEEVGRLGDGRALGQFVLAARSAHERAVKGQVETLARPGAKLGRNDPCPCGSGKKFKRCCMQR